VSKSPYVFNVTDADFEAKVLQKSKETPVVVDFWAPWCGPCRMLGPILEKQVADRQGAVLLAKVNTDEEQRLAMNYQVEALPTVVAFRDGKPFLDFVGLLPEPEIAAFLERLAPSAADKQTQEAATLEKSDPARAEQLYRQALQGDPKQEAALVGLGRLLIQRGQDKEAEEILENVGAEGERGLEAERLRAILWLKQRAAGSADVPALRNRVEADPKDAQARHQLGLRTALTGDYPAALELFLSAGRLDRKLAGSQVREAMVKVFQIVGVRSPLADQYREQLSALLY
jgi:putative thioredoxin